MKSTENRYYPNLDHVRAVAAFFVFVWHFKGENLPNHIHPGPLGLSLLNEGHCGVSLFVVLSGYLFTKLLADRQINILKFYANRAIRLAPLLLVALALHTWVNVRNGKSLAGFSLSLVKGFILPTWPGGGWSITTELHFYVLLPLLLVLYRRRPLGIGGIVIAALLFRQILWAWHGSVQQIAYFTILGRIDQFLCGMMGWYFASRIKGQHLVAAGVLGAFLIFYYGFDRAGGFADMPAYPSPAWIWVVMPTVEGVAFSILIVYYDQTFAFKKNMLGSMVALLGTISYSLYLLHPFFIRTFSRLFATYVFPITTFAEALVGAAVGFGALVPFAWVSYRLIERPALRLRMHYLE